MTYEIKIVFTTIMDLPLRGSIRDLNREEFLLLTVRTKFSIFELIEKEVIDVLKISKQKNHWCRHTFLRLLSDSFSVIPRYKKGYPPVPSTYRPISITPAHA